MTYALTFRPLILRDSPENLDYHIRSDDYFGALATIMGFLEEALTLCTSDSVSTRERDMAREVRHDLRYIEANYKIVPRAPEDVRLVRPSGNILPKKLEDGKL